MVYKTRVAHRARDCEEMDKAVDEIDHGLTHSVLLTDTASCQDDGTGTQYLTAKIVAF